ncbi:MAG TPA: hypothetical protein VMT99_01170 [Candidatus Paceibacterota bacterium]|nr:hypothetical protein [Candidatus Paceibacterota bacterium]
MMNQTAKLPPDTITVKGGRVVKFEHWVLWDGEPFPTITIERTGERSFRSFIGDPEHGGAAANGKTLRDVVAGLHQKFQDQYDLLFDLRQPSLEAIRALGFQREEVEFQPC